MWCWCVRRNPMWAQKLVLFAGLALSTCGLRGNDAWLKPERFKVTPGATLRFQILAAERFSADKTSPIAAPDYEVKARLGSELIAAALVDKDRERAVFGRVPRRSPESSALFFWKNRRTRLKPDSARCTRVRHCERLGGDRRRRRRGANTCDAT